MRFDAIFPLRPPLRFDSARYNKTFECMLTYFNIDRRLNLKGNDPSGGDTLVVRIERCPASFKQKFLRDKRLFKTGDWLLCFSEDFCFPGADKFFLMDPAGKKMDYTSNELSSMWASLLPNMLDPSIQTYICALTLAFPGAVQPVTNLWLMDHKRHHFSSCYVSEVHDSLEYLLENGISPKDGIDPERFIDLVFSQNGVLDGVSGTPAARAFNYFTRLFVREHRNDELSDLVWALAGIESLLVEGVGHRRVSSEKSLVRSLD